MMSNYIITCVALAVICLFTASCTTRPSPGNPADPYQQPIVISKSTRFTFSIPHGHRVQLQLLNSSNTAALNNPVGNLYFYDDNCTLGHQASLSYKPNEADNLTLYFAKELQWNKSHQLILEWDDSTSELHVRLDDQVFAIKTIKKARFLAIYRSPSFTFEKIELLINQGHGR